MSSKRSTKTKISSNWLSEEEKTPKTRKKYTYKCYCQKTYSSAAYLARHILKHHPQNNGVNADDPNVKNDSNNSENMDIPGVNSITKESLAKKTKNAVKSSKRVQKSRLSTQVPSPGEEKENQQINTKAPKKKLHSKGKLNSTYKYRKKRPFSAKNETSKDKSTSQYNKTSSSHVNSAKKKQKGNLEDHQLKSHINADISTLLDIEPNSTLDNDQTQQSVFDFNDASDDELDDDAIGYIIDESTDDEYGSSNSLLATPDIKTDILDESTSNSLFSPSLATSTLTTPNSTPAKSKKHGVRSTYQSGKVRRLYSCHICPRNYISSGKLKRHMKTHTEEGQKRLFACVICQKSFNSNSVLIAHIRVHTGEKPFKCDECKMAFKQTSHLNRHKRVHSGEKPFICDICKKSFPHNFNLVIHKRKHTGEKPYICNVCNHPFADRSNLNKHMPRCLKRLCEVMDNDDDEYNARNSNGDDDACKSKNEKKRKRNIRRKIKFEDENAIDDEYEDIDFQSPVTFEQVVTQPIEEILSGDSYITAPMYSDSMSLSRDYTDLTNDLLDDSLLEMLTPDKSDRKINIDKLNTPKSNHNNSLNKSSVTATSTPIKNTTARGKKKAEGIAAVTPTSSTSKKRQRSKQDTKDECEIKKISTPKKSPKRTPVKSTANNKNERSRSCNQKNSSHPTLSNDIFQEEPPLPNLSPSLRLNPTSPSMAFSPLQRASGCGNQQTNSDFARLANQILEEPNLPMEEDESSLTAELLMQVNSSWLDQTKALSPTKSPLNPQASHSLVPSSERPPPVSELFKVRPPPDLGETSSEGNHHQSHMSRYHMSQVTETDTSWSSSCKYVPPLYVTSLSPHHQTMTSPSHIANFSTSPPAIMTPCTTANCNHSMSPVLSHSANERPTTDTNTMAMELDYQAKTIYNSPVHYFSQNAMTSPTQIEAGVEEVYARSFSMTSPHNYDYDSSALEVNINNIIISEPNRDY